MSKEPVITKGKKYKSLQGPSEGEVGVCIETWKTSFESVYLKLKTASGLHSLRGIDVELVEDESVSKK